MADQERFDAADSRQHKKIHTNQTLLDFKRVLSMFIFMVEQNLQSSPAGSRQGRGYRA